MEKGEKKAFCEGNFKPLIIGLIAVVVLILGWVVYHEVMIRNSPDYAKQYHVQVHHPNGVPAQ